MREWSSQHQTITLPPQSPIKIFLAKPKLLKQLQDLHLENELQQKYLVSSAISPLIYIHLTTIRSNYVLQINSFGIAQNTRKSC